MRARPAEILRTLTGQEVEFVVVGMTAAVLHGAPVTTLDLDIVHPRTAQNVSRLLRSLTELEAVHRHDPRGLRPQESHLIGPGHQLLTTRWGDLDCLGELEGGVTYEDLVASAARLQLDDGRTILVQDLPGLIAVKERLARPKDLAVLPVLRATLAEQRRAAGETE